MEEEKVDLIGNIELKNYELYFGTRKDYFIPKLIDFEKGKRISFNIGPFFFGIFWFLYRRLYIHSLIIFIIVIFELFIERQLLKRIGNSQNAEITLRIIWLLVSGIILGYLGIYFFLKQSKKKIENIMNSSIDEFLKIKRLKKSGSGNWILVLSTIIVLIVMIILGQK